MKNIRAFTFPMIAVLLALGTGCSRTSHVPASCDKSTDCMAGIIERTGAQRVGDVRFPWQWSWSSFWKTQYRRKTGLVNHAVILCDTGSKTWSRYKANGDFVLGCEFIRTYR